MKRSWKLIALLLASCGAILGAGAAAEEKAGPASVGGKGKFSSAGWNFELGSAFAFPGKLSLGDGKGVIVALTNAGITASEIAVWVDRRWIFDNWIKDQETLVAYLEFKATGGRLQGTVRGEVKDKGSGELEYALDLELDVPIEAELPGKPLPAGGGEPGAAYLELHRLLREGKNAEVRERLDAEWKEHLADAGAEALQQFYGGLQEKHPDTVSIVDGFVDGDRAVLRIRGEKSWGKLRGEVRMDREGGAWRYGHGWTTVDFGE